MRRVMVKTFVLVFLLLFQMITDAAAQGSLKLPITGAAVNGGSFSGTVALSKFETRGDQIVAIGFISGTLSNRTRTLGTALVGEVAIPVTVRARGVSTIKGPQLMQPQLRRVALSTAAAPELRLVQAASCPVVDIVLGPFTVNVLGVDVAIQPIDLQLEGQQGTPLGDLVCQANALIGNVAGLVGVVNSILGLLLGLLGGLGGVIPSA
jgi:hypothetical protein